MRLYRIVVHDEVLTALDAMPVALLVDYAAAVDAAAATPWDCDPINADHPDAEVRRLLFGPLGVGQLVFVIVESSREVHLLQVTVWELPD